jgi:MFS superfamily sulfate permease-like transporter
MTVLPQRSKDFHLIPLLNFCLHKEQHLQLYIVKINRFLFFLTINNIYNGFTNVQNYTFELWHFDCYEEFIYTT